MNVYAIVILAALVLDTLLGLVSDALNLRHMSPTVPDAFAGIYEAEAYARSQSYLRTHTRFGMLTSSASLAAVLAFWFLGGFAWMDGLVRGWFDHPVLRGVAFIAVIALLRYLFSLPFSIYATFVIEERFGFNCTTWKTFVLDRVKGICIAAAVGVPILAAVLWFLEYAGPHAWLYCWGVTALFSLVMTVIAPVWIMPLFNTFSPLADGELREAISAYTARVGYPDAKLFCIDGSRRSTHSNAYFTGLGKTKRIALFDTLIEHHDVQELVAIVAHEVGHWTLGHIWKTLVFSIIHSGVMFFLLSVFITHKGLFEAFGVPPSTYAGLVFFGMLYAPVEMVLSVILNAVSRRHEYDADAFAARTTGDATPMCRALKSLSMHNMSNLTPHPLTVWLEYSHPPVLARLSALSDQQHTNTAMKPQADEHAATNTTTGPLA